MRQVAAAALRDAMLATGTPMAGAARDLGIGETVMAGIARGDKPLEAARILEMPRTLREAVLEALRRESDRLAAEQAPRAHVSVDQRLRHVGKAFGRSCEAADEALLDGVIDAEERRALLPVVHELVARAVALEAEVAKAGER